MMKFYYPGRKFPSFSTTGNFCNLNCPHCRGKYLQGMEETKTAEILYEKAIELESIGGNGFLLSGGCDSEGKVVLDGYYKTLKRLKEETNLIINVHTGLPTAKMVDNLSESNIDVISYDMIGSKKTIKEIYGIGKNVQDYVEGFELLKEGGLEVVPHITIGLYHGEIRGEYKAIDFVKDSEKIILNSLIPSNFGKSIPSEKYLSLVKYALSETDAEIILGCMRERGRSKLEIESLKLGVSGIVLPSKKTKDWANSKYDIERKEVCCAV